MTYSGAGSTTDRVINLAGSTGGGTLDQSGTGLLDFTSGLTVTTSGAKTFTLQGSTAGTGQFDGAIVNGSGTVALVKAGTGTWTLTNAGNTYSGGTTLTGGTLSIAADGALGASSGGVTFNGGSLQITGTTNNALAATRSLTLTGAATFDINNVANTYVVSQSGTAGGAVTKLGAGTLNFTGALLNFNGKSVTVSAGTLIKSGASGGAAGAITVGNLAGNATLNIANGGTLVGTTLTVGAIANAVGAVNIVTGGTLNPATPETTDTNVSFGAITGAYGALYMTGGTYTESRFQFGGVSGSGGTGVGLVAGGTVNTNGYLILARDQASIGELTITGGTINHTSASQNIYLGLAATGTGRAELTIAGGLVDNTGKSVSFSGGGFNVGAGFVGVLNLNSGTLLTNSIAQGSVGTSIVNFNGGTLKVAATGTILAPAGTGTLTNYVNGAFGSFNGGAVIDTNNSAATISANLVAPTGKGVASLAITNAGSGYIGAPYVQITGNGVGATGYAVVDVTAGSATFGQVTSIVITNPGVNYTTASVTLVNGGGTGATASPTLNLANSSGGLTKIGANTLTLSGANTYSGPTLVNVGILKAGVASVANVSGAFGNNSAVTLANIAGVSLDITGFNTQIGSLSGGGGTGGNVTLGAATLTIGGDNTSPAAYAGAISSTGTPTTSVIKIGTGIESLSGVNLYIGATQVNAGTLNVNGSLAVASAVTVGGASASGTPTLTGTGGTVGGSVTLASAGGGAAGILNPGTVGTVGTLTAGSVAFNSGSTFAIDLGAGSNNADKLVITGAATISSGALITFNQLTTPDQGKYVLATATSGLASNPFTGTAPTGYNLVAISTELDLIHKATIGTITPTLAASTPTGSIITGGSLAFSFTATNSAPAGSSSLNFTTAAGTNVTGTVAGTTTVAAGSTSSAVTGLSFNGATVGASQSGSFTLTDPNATNSPQTGTVSVNVYDHATSNLTTGTLALGNIHVGYTAPVTSNSLTATNGSNTDFRVNLKGNATPSGNISLSSISAVAPGGSGTVQATLATGQAIGAISTPFTYTFADDSLLSGASANVGIANLTTTGLVYSGQSTWITNGDGTWGTLASNFGTNWGANQGSPGLDPGFTNTDTATFGDILTGNANVTLDGALPSLKGITFNSTSGFGYTIAQGTGSGFLTLSGNAGDATILDSAGSHTISASGYAKHWLKRSSHERSGYLDHLRQHQRWFEHRNDERWRRHLDSFGWKQCLRQHGCQQRYDSVRRLGWTGLRDGHGNGRHRGCNGIGWLDHRQRYDCINRRRQRYDQRWW